MNQLANRPIVPKSGLKPRRMKATKAEQERYAQVAALGCICCRELGRSMNAELHHPTKGGRRIGNEKVLPLCPWHHRAQIPQGCRNSMEAHMGYGPSLHTKCEFVLSWGSEEWLLEQVNKLLGEQK